MSQKYGFVARTIGPAPVPSASDGVPPGAELQHVAFSVGPGPGRTEPVDVPATKFHRGARSEAERVAAPAAADLVVLSLVSDGQDDDAELLVKVRAWVDAAAPGAEPPSQLITLQGAHLFWSQGRAAVVAKADRLVSVRAALIEVSAYEAELRALETTLGELWPQLEADAPLAFEFEERSVRKRSQLAKQFQQILSLRARVARITPHVLHPHVHPPTLASQVGERLRERTRMAARLEFLGGQIEVFERVYEACGQRASDFMLARTSHTLEWVIILLLLVQIILIGAEMVAKGGK